MVGKSAPIVRRYLEKLAGTVYVKVDGSTSNISLVRLEVMGLKNKLPGKSEEEQLQLLDTNGILVKHPIVTDEDKVLVGFRESEWEQLPIA